ncbi:MAG: glycerol kinase GlpK [Microbacteriaceae bacterium]|nr:glycerol kinase GlpK [Microbacteriaceae bacterium]
MTFLLAIDQGTTSTRAIVFDKDANIRGQNQLEHEQIFPKPGWVEHDPLEIWENTKKVIAGAIADAQIQASKISAIGITNQRETTVIWDKTTGNPIYNAIVWQDTRTQEYINEISDSEFSELSQSITGLPLATYFSASKAKWILDNAFEGTPDFSEENLLLGTIDSWLLWNLTGGINSGLHKTDITNASRTLLFNIQTLEWDTQMMQKFAIPESLLPLVQASSSNFGSVNAGISIDGIAITGILGDQHAALFGQTAFSPGETKCTYGTGNFILFNTGNEIVHSENGLITTIAYQLSGESPVYALEGSVAVSGSLVQWLRDNLQIIDSSQEIEQLAESVPDTGGMYIVPAFSGLFAPYWRPDARGIMVGLTRFINKAHIARAALEAIALQTADIVNAFKKDSGFSLEQLKVDGGASENDLLMQIQADFLDVEVIRPLVTETTALGAAYAAGLQAGVWKSPEELKSHWAENRRWKSKINSRDRESKFQEWAKAIEKSLEWV